MPPPNSFSRPGRIDARPSNVAYDPTTGTGTGRTARRSMGSFSGLNNYYALQDRTQPAFASRDGIYGMGPSAEEESRVATRAGLMYNPNAGAYVPDTLYNRTTGYQNPYSRFGAMQVNQPQEGATKPSLTPQQQEWADAAKAKSEGNAMPTAGSLISHFLSSLTRALGRGMQQAGEAKAASSTIAPNPYSGTREQNIANAKAAGKFDQVMNDYNAKYGPMGYTMNEKGEINRDMDKLKRDLADEKRLKRGETLDVADIASPTGKGKRVNITSPYGSGSSILGRGTGPSIVRDDFGNMVPMKDYLERKRYVQATKGMV